MAKDFYTENDEMLVLAAIAYRGFDLALPETPKRQAMYRAMEKCLNTLGPVKGKWEIVWGPASYSAGPLALDDCAMYVARNCQTPSTFVIAIRGTNPPSLTDWIFGDFMVNQLVSWPFGGISETVKVSFSTMFGLKILQGLRWDPLTQIPIEADSSDAWINRIQHLTSSLSAITARKLMDAAANAVGTPLDPGAHGREMRDKAAEGVDLLSFLKTVISESNSAVNLYVTGHSKGALLSSTLALWLADTQGASPVPQNSQWDPDRKAVVHAYSFAGPTAGNGSFVAHSDAIIGPRCHRVFNPLDIVPHVWAVEDLRRIPSLYGTAEPALQKIVDSVIARVATLDYKQVGSLVTELPPSPHPGTPLAIQVLFQHLDGYLQSMGLLDEMSAVGTFLNPLPT